MADCSPSSIYAIVLCGVGLLLVHLYYRAQAYLARSRGRPLPPGPRRLPIVGNLFDIPKRHPWIAYEAYSRQYGKVTSFEAMGQMLIIVDDPNIAIELLEKRSAIYSSRPYSIAVELSGWSWNLAMIPYGQAWRLRRRVVWQYFHPGALEKYNDSLEENARRVLRKLLAGSADDLKNDIRYVLNSSLIKVAYGLETAAQDDKHISTFEVAIASVDLLLSGTHFIDFLPFLTRLPSWFPGMAILDRMAYYHRAVTTMKDDTWNDAKSAMMSGKPPTSVAGALIHRLFHLDEEAVPEQEEIFKEAVGVSYAAAIDTTHATLCAFFFAMSLCPDVQKKAREELDAVVGPDRLPALVDRPKLPYINAIMKETLRWHTATPMAIAHTSTADDTYDGFFIPQGSTVMVNAWSILHDSKKYPQPDAFVPDRFMKDGELNLEAGDPAKFAFGFGRRICPGRYFAEAALFIYIASVLHTLDITPPLDEHGRPIHIETRYTSELVTHLEDCRCNVKPRSRFAEILIRSAE